MSDKTNAADKYRWLVFAVTMIGTFMATLDASIVNVALPVIATSFRTDLAIVQWVVTAYLLVVSSLLPLFGRLGDIWGRRLVYTVGFLFFTAGSGLCGIAGHIWWLVGFRAFQAIGAAMIMANSPAIVATLFPGKQRGRALGMVGTIVALGTMTGPSLGGILVGTWGWEYIFFINLPIGIVAFLLGQVVLPTERVAAAGRFDLCGAGLFALGMTCLLLVLSSGHEWGWFSPKVLLGTAVALVSLVLFVWYERRIEEPMIDLSLFRHWQFLSGTIASFLSFMAIFTNTILLPFYLHSILALSPTQIGFVITPFPLLLAVVAPLSGYLSERVHLLLLTVTGLVITAAGLFYMAMLGAQAQMWQVAVGQAIMGIGNGMFQSPNNNSVLTSVETAKLGVASGINAMVRNIGMVSGTAMAVSIFETKRLQELAGVASPSVEQLTRSFLVAYQEVLLIGAGIALAAALISLKRQRITRSAPAQ